MISLKKCGEIAVSIFVKCVTIIQIIFLFVLINATFQQWSFKIPPLIVMIAINLCLIFCTKMGKIPTEYWQWKKDKVGIFLIWLNSFGYLVSKIIKRNFSRELVFRDFNSETLGLESLSLNDNKKINMFKLSNVTGEGLDYFRTFLYSLDNRIDWKAKRRNVCVLMCFSSVSCMFLNPNYFFLI